MLLKISRVFSGFFLLSATIYSMTKTIYASSASTRLQSSMISIIIFTSRFSFFEMSENVIYETSYKQDNEKPEHFVVFDINSFFYYCNTCRKCCTDKRKDCERRLLLVFYAAINVYCRKAQKQKHCAKGA